MSPRPSWDTPPPQQPEPERSYPERYIFLLLFFVVFIRILKMIKKHRPEEEFDPALDELDVEAGTDVEAGSWSLAVDGTLYWEETPCGTYHDNNRSSDNAYHAAVSSLVSLDEEPHSATDICSSNPTSNIHIPEHDIRSINAQRVQHLVAKLRAASYAAQNEPEGSPGRRGIEVLRRQIMEMVVIGNSEYALRPPPDPVEPPPPAYSDVVKDSGTDSVPPPPPRSPTRPTPPRLIIP